MSHRPDEGFQPCRRLTAEKQKDEQPQQVRSRAGFGGSLPNPSKYPKPSRRPPKGYDEPLFSVAQMITTSLPFAGHATGG
jgi:hypothetical protein